MTAVMFGSFAVIPFISVALVDNSGVKESQLPFLYVLGGACTLISSPLIGKMADRFGKLRVYQFMAVFSILPFVLTTNLPRVPLFAAMMVVALMMVCNSGRMIPAVAMITASVERSRRGGFMSVNACVQHLAAGLGTAAAAKILGNSGLVTPDRFRIVGLVSVVAVLVSLPLAGRLRKADETPEKPMGLAEECGFAAEF